MVGRLLFFTVLPSLLGAQFRNLSTTDDGSLLTFSSALQMQGTDQFSWDKLFTVDSSGLALLAQQQKQDPPIGSRMSNYYLLERAELSGDGSVRALVTGRVCVLVGSGCLFIATIQSQVSGLPGQTMATFTGDLRISRNGRYALQCCDHGAELRPTLVDLTTGRTNVAADSLYNISVRGMVASTGVAILPTQAQSLLLVTLSGTQTFVTSGKTAQAVIDDGGTSAIYQSQADAHGNLLARVDLQTGVETAVVRGVGLSLVGITNDGRTVAFLSSSKLTSAETGGLAQLFTVQADGSGLRQITQDPAGLVEATYAGKGTVAFAVTAAGRLVRIDVTSGTVKQLIGRTVTLQTPSTSISPYPVGGSAYCVRGTGLADSPNSGAAPLPLALGGLQLLLDGAAVPLLSAAPAQACFQVPWDTTTGTHTLSAVTNSDPTFQNSTTASLGMNWATFASFLRLGPQYPVGVSLETYPLAAHQGFSGLVTWAQPARPGEIIHFYMTGLGPVDPPVPLGSAAPSNPPAAVTTSFACSFSDFKGGSAPLPVLFAGLAPGFVGVYQVSVLLPDDMPTLYGESLIYCKAGSPYAGESAWIPMFVQPCPVSRLSGPPLRRCVETLPPNQPTR
jgi:uncharacterized protein (TIGR03437 family)